MKSFFLYSRDELCVLLIFFGFSSCSAENEGNWKIGGKIHFEERSGVDYVGTIAINNLIRKILHETFDVQSDSCLDNAKVLIKPENGRLIIQHYEEKSKPGVGEEMHATLLVALMKIMDFLAALLLKI